MTTEVSQQSTGGFHFGLEAGRVKDRLQEIIAGIEAGTILLQGVEQSVSTLTDDYQMKGLVLKYVEKD